MKPYTIFFAKKVKKVSKNFADIKSITIFVVLRKTKHKSNLFNTYNYERIFNVDLLGGIYRRFFHFFFN